MLSRLFCSFASCASSFGVPASWPMISVTSVAIACTTSSCAFAGSASVRCSGQTTRRCAGARRASSRQMLSEPSHVVAPVRRIGMRSAGLPE